MMKILKLLFQNILFITIALGAGCASPPMTDLSLGLDYLMVRPASEAFKALGYPTSEKSIDGDLIYIWFHDRSAIVNTPKKDRIIGTIGNTPVSGHVSYVESNVVRSGCEIRLVVDAHSRLLFSWELNGSYNGCATFAQRLNDYRGK